MNTDTSDEAAECVSKGYDYPSNTMNHSQAFIEGWQLCRKRSEERERKAFEWAWNVSAGGNVDNIKEAYRAFKEAQK